MIYHGDLFSVLPTLAAESIDAAITDPPYGISFMGKSWDNFSPTATKERILPNHEIESDNPNLKGRTRAPASSPSAVEYNRSLAGQREFQEWTERWAREVFRVLKPGAHLLVCGAPRSFHRMACGIEDAGFEVRDCLSWLFGSGFPKSLNVSKAIDKTGGVSCDGDAVATHIREKRKAAGISVVEMASWFPYKEVTKNWERLDAGQRIPSAADYAVLVERLSADPTLEIRRAAAEREVIARKGDGLAQSWARNGDAGYEKEYDVTAASTDAAKKWDGWGTALKPGWEPIFVARKPFSGTVAANALEHGTGALNIDACRIRSTDGQLAEKYASVQNAGSRENTIFGKDARDRAGAEPNDAGRWPANVLLSHTPDCREVGAKRVKGSTLQGDKSNDRRHRQSDFGMSAGVHGGFTDSDGMEEVEAWECSPDCPVRLLDEQTGELASGVAVQRNGGGQRIGYGSDPESGGMFRDDVGFGGTGGASRFFYCAKPSREERDYGCESLPKSKAGSLNMRTDAHAVATGNETAPSRNIHPTVKPIKLMRWLVRLVTPPNGRVLDPFGGSFTTAMACAYEQRQFAIIEREAEYVEIGVRRVSAVNPLFADAEELCVNVIESLPKRITVEE